MNEGGNVVRDLRADIAAEDGALNTYEQLIAMCAERGTREALTRLATREVSHTHMFMEALRSLNALDQPLFGDLKPDGTVNLYFNLSDGQGGEQRGPWNQEPTFAMSPIPCRDRRLRQGQSGRNAKSSPASAAGGASARR